MTRHAKATVQRSPYALASLIIGVILGASAFGFWLGA